MTNDKYFDDPRTAVEVSTYLLLDENWAEIACYYYLKDTDLTYDDINCSNFFMQNKKPKNNPLPALYWKYKHPFPPGYRYLFTEPIDVDIMRIWLTNKFEVGEGVRREGRHSFLMKYTINGYQFIPPIEYLKVNISHLIS